MTRLAVGGLCCALLSSSVLSAQALSRSQLAEIDSVVTRQMRDRRIPGAAITVIDRGKVVLAKAYGFANLETETLLAAVGQLGVTYGQGFAIGRPRPLEIVLQELLRSGPAPRSGSTRPSRIGL